jgi:mRNA interferase MazF
MVIKQGEIYWVDLGEPTGSEPAYRHPHIVVQNNLFNASHINTIVVCSLTSNLIRAGSPSNVLLKKML